MDAEAAEVDLLFAQDRKAPSVSATSSLVPPSVSAPSLAPRCPSERWKRLARRRNMRRARSEKMSLWRDLSVSRRRRKRRNVPSTVTVQAPGSTADSGSDSVDPAMLLCWTGS